ncbi:hypothetical protein [Lachnobacterium bovis]|uniref:hypothetical protein n=1 Tax=Lachnobacterium bovis TaxID=140626 RepID=UPI0003B74236|nr:hypothetical protein [Lachnobacterium bovis]
MLKKGEVDLTEKYEEQAKYLVGLVDECSHNFMEKYDIVAQGNKDVFFKII